MSCRECGQEGGLYRCSKCGRPLCVACLRSEHGCNPTGQYAVKREVEHERQPKHF